MKATIAITFKPGVLDPEAATIGQSLQSLGFAEVSSVKRVRLIELEVADGTAKDRIQEMCDKLLANPVIETYRIEIPD